MNKPSKKTVFFICVALAAVLLAVVIAICANLFIKADRQSHDARILKLAVTEATSAAETLKASDGDLEAAGQLMREHTMFNVSEDTLTLYYDDELKPASSTNSPYSAVITKNDSDNYHSYEIIISETSTGNEIYSLSFKAIRSGGSAQ